MPVDPKTLAWNNQELRSIEPLLYELKQILGSQREEQALPSRTQLDSSVGFVPTYQYEDLVREPYVVRVIRGPKGSGKSAFASALVNDYQGHVKEYAKNEGLAEVLVIEAFPIVDNLGIDDDSSNLIDPLSDYFKQLNINRVNLGSVEESAKFIWKAFFYALEILALDRYFLKTGNESSRLKFNQLRQQLSTVVVKLIDSDIANQRLASASSKKFVANFIQGIGLPGIPPNTKVEDDLLQKVKFSLAAIARELEDLVQSHKIEVWVVLDRVDDILRFESPAQIAAAGSLFAAATEHAATDSSLRLRLFLRGDLIDRIPKMGITIENSDVPLTSAISLRWSRVDLEWLVVNRLSQSKLFKSEIVGGRNINERKSRRRILTGLFPSRDYSSRYHSLQPYVATKSDITYWEWLMRHVADGNLLYNPRYMLMALKFTVDAALNNIKRGEERPVPANNDGSRVLFLPDDLEKAYQELSTTALELVKNSFPELAKGDLVDSLSSQELWNSEAELRQHLRTLNADIDEKIIQNFVETLDLSGILFKDRRTSRCFVAPIFRYKISASPLLRAIEPEDEDNSAFPGEVKIS